MLSESTRCEAEHFLKNETAFHLGEMLTEQSHPVTRKLSQTLAENTAAGLELILRVDDDLPPVAKRVIGSEVFRNLEEDIYKTLESGNRVFFSGCGATGRLAILLDAAHRRFCVKCAALMPEKADFFETLCGQTFAVMTGGDFALIRSVESFEDFIVFGKRQMQDAGFTKWDTLIAISEGGETSSVIGTIHAAIELGARTYFLFNNPAELMSRMVERSRIVMTDPRVKIIELATGPMAVAGSTRMQATTMELLVASLAFESALDRFLCETLDAATIEKITPLGRATRSPEQGLERFETLLKQVRLRENLSQLAALTDLEHDIYGASGLVTYYPDEYSLDIFTDTTERSPTFKTPPFRSTLEEGVPVSWAYVKDPMRTTDDAWRQLLGREPFCIEWTPDDYRAMNAPERIINQPPKIDRAILKTYKIGCELDETRTAAKPNIAFAFLVDGEFEHLATKDAWHHSFVKGTEHFEKRGAILFGPHQPHLDSLAGLAECFFVQVDLPASPLNLMAHLAVKLALNAVSTATMGKLGRLSGNWMAHVDATNKKLIDRSIRLVSELAEVNYETACYALFESVEKMKNWPESQRKTISPAAYTIRRLDTGLRPEGRSPH